MEITPFKKLLIAAWLGFIFALWLMVRWRMMGSKAKWDAVPDPEPSGESEPTADAGHTEHTSVVTRVRQVGSRFGEHVVIGAKADVDRVQAMLRRGV